MSAESSLVTERHFKYLAERTAPEDDFLRDLKRDAKKAGIPAIQISPEQASLMQILLKLANAREVIEVGTLAGYSAIWMARAGCRVHTIELVVKHADFAEKWIAKSDVADRVKVYRGAGNDVLPQFAANSMDACFLDADKSGYPAYLQECLRIVRAGGLFMVDNAFAFGQLFDKKPTDREVPAVRKFNDVMAAEKRLQSIIVPIGDGLWVGVKS